MTEAVKKTSIKKTGNYYYAVGRRKTAVATVRLFKGNGKITINDIDAEIYLNNKTLVHAVKSPLVLVGKAASVDISVKVKGGGKKGQAQAISLGIARALNVMSGDLRVSLKKAGYLTRDPRKKERKKYGLKKARKAPQFSKR
ncbi:MAG: 30S ribosomal protein S9 [bacterium]|nr:30S ribosomal protein S9 [bacterium]